MRMSAHARVRRLKYVGPIKERKVFPHKCLPQQFLYKKSPEVSYVSVLYKLMDSAKASRGTAVLLK